MATIYGNCPGIIIWIVIVPPVVQRVIFQLEIDQMVIFRSAIIQGAIVLQVEVILLEIVLPPVMSVWIALWEKHCANRTALQRPSEADGHKVNE
jgi:hypothetical protein